MKSVLLSTAVVAFGLSMSACSSISFDINNVKFDDDVWAQEETVVVAAAAVAVGGYFLWDQTRQWHAEREAAEREQQERSAYDYWDTAEAQRSQEFDACSMTREQLIAFSKEYEFYGGDLSGMSPEQHADFMIALC